MGPGGALSIQSMNACTCPSAIWASAASIAAAVPASPLRVNAMKDRPPFAAVGGGWPSVSWSDGTQAGESAPPSAATWFSMVSCVSKRCPPVRDLVLTAPGVCTFRDSGPIIAIVSRPCRPQ